MSGTSPLDPTLRTDPVHAAGTVGTDPPEAVGGSTATGPGTSASGTGEDRSLGEIVGDLSHDLTTLVKQELELARTELKEEAAKAGKGAGLLGGAGVAGLLTLFFASFAVAFLLDNWMPVELAFLIVTLLWGVVAGILASRGRTAIKQINPQLPETQQTLKEDATWARAQKS